MKGTSMLGYWCVVCGRLLASDDAGVIVHDNVPHPDGIRGYPTMIENGITHYCLGSGELKCDGCGQEKNWQTLNQLPDTLRKTLQSQAQRIDDTDCILAGRPWYKSK